MCSHPAAWSPLWWWTCSFDVVALLVDLPYSAMCFFQMVLVLKKEVVKTNNAIEHEDVGKYRQLLVRTLHQCSVKFPDVAATVIPVVSGTVLHFGWTFESTVPVSPQHDKSCCVAVVEIWSFLPLLVFHYLLSETLRDQLNNSKTVRDMSLGTQWLACWLSLSPTLTWGLKSLPFKWQPNGGWWATKMSIEHVW